MNKNVIELRNMGKRIKNKTIFEGINFSIPSQTITTIFGESGSGKSTLLNIMGLIDNYNEGDYLLFGEKSPAINSRKALLDKRFRLSYLFQNFGLLENQTIDYNLNIGLQYTKLTKKESMDKKKEAMEKVHLNTKLSTKIYQLSGGEKQRVALARTIIKPSQLIFADEPTGSLDSVNRDLIFELLTEQKKEGKTIILVSHDKDILKKSDIQIFLK
ncbi:bacteriocin ABC transporter ATP-binding protein [Carnobacterium divergens]|uniref:ATP-binding cassette domain-containing protein n=1 Tax=Carnobacterium divergens TaxID=2748 RepID=UPI000D4CDF13|nr:ATP-binding cassette domain-containing protein [Carnobacterium divergens]MCO6018746.1 ATP-binding cassette domain-containing protein [Carnobacterium divergens]TFI63930.1 bacteriocin ABC transporter ATP-binding protein [Carnobacterium divergens]TFI91093.1 bacteriocin ABC transporter ATP-binding protein [Carnobacterium divergens]TFJ05960.1 bacteriocin ABC transporter ATP-binding protein [Carnobacterium divergens]TFJ07608.1 bacteriocin ABC transporter ATP-binding protein [Carnobacterium diverg